MYHTHIRNEESPAIASYLVYICVSAFAGYLQPLLSVARPPTVGLVLGSAKQQLGAIVQQHMLWRTDFGNDPQNGRHSSMIPKKDIH